MMTTPQDTEAAAATATSPTGTEARVCADITRRQALGLAKYGTTVEANSLPLPAWLQHAYEETLDQAIYLRRAMEEMGQQPQTEFQERVEPWLLACFGEEIAADPIERNHRFLEESLELVQACGCTQSEAHQLVDYVFGRPVGEVQQEAGGVMVTLAALCRAQGISMHEAGEKELARIWTKVEAIRAKQAAKPKHSPLPEPAAALAHQAVPEGWKLVPAEPTEAMFTAFGRQIEKGVVYVGGFLLAYRCMLAAAQAAPQASQGAAVGDGPTVEEQRELLKRLRYYGDNDRDAACALIERLGADLYAAEGRANSLARKLAEAQGCISGWVEFGGNVTDALGLRVMYPKQILAEIERLRSAAGPLPKGWTLNHAQQQTDEDGPVEGVWEIGFLDPEDDRFSPLITVDTSLYYREQDAEPLARAILARRRESDVPVQDGKEPHHG